MRFACDNCHAQYIINDEKVGPKGAKLHCKKCKQVILVRMPETSAAPEPVSTANTEPSPPQAPLTSNNPSAATILEGLGDDEIGAAFDLAFEAADGSAPMPTESSSPPPEAMDPGFGEDLEGSSQAADPSPAPIEMPPIEHEWFVAIDDKQVGPLMVDRLKRLWDSGEIGPDSLCWRAGLSDWMALSEVTELSSLLAPKPPKPVIIAQPPASARSAAAPVEAILSGSPKLDRFEAPTADSSTPAANGPGAWQPTAATALASLMKEELSALNQPAAKPMSISESAPRARTSLISGSVLQVPQPEISFAPLPRFGLPPEGKSKKGIVVVAVFGSLAVLGGVVALTAWLTGPSRAPAPVAATMPERPVAAEPSKPAPPPVPPAAKVESPPPPKEDKPALVAAKEVPAAPSADNPTGRRERGNSRSRRRSGGEEAAAPAKEEKKEALARAVPRPAEASDREFEETFGGGEKPAAEKRDRKTVYVPPAPGSASDIPESLGQSDIMQIVVSNKSSILGCVADQKKRDPSSSGRIVMRWSIQPNGRTSNISCQSDEFKGSPVASCIGGLIKGWTFPRHRVQGDPINFPFTF
jgi:predicted Zn finger-like uncharacterized protein